METKEISAPDILSPEFAADPYPFYEVFRERYPAHFDERLGWIISRFEDVHRAFTDAAFSTESYAAVRELVGRSILEMDGKEHAVHRRLVAPSFRGKALDSYAEVIEEAAIDLISSFKPLGRADLVESFCAQLPIRVIMGILGLPAGDYERFQNWYRAAAAYVGNYAGDPDVAAAGLQAKAELDHYLTQVLAERRRSPGSDLMSSMCTAEADGVGLSDQEIIDFCSLLLAAGGETTERGLASTLRNLLDHPEQLRMVRDDYSLIETAFAETIRVNPPTHIILRQLTTDVEISETSIPAGSTVFCLIGAANRDPRRYARSEEFDVARDDLDMGRAFTAGANHMGFGAGRHFCVGAVLAKAEAEIGLRLLLETIPDLGYAPGFVPVEEGTLTRAPRSIRVVFTPVVG